MSIKAINWAMNCLLKPLEKLVLLVLANHANDKGECWPSFDHLCQQTGMARSTLNIYLSVLDQKNFIKKQKRQDKFGHRQSNMYLLNLSQSTGVILRDDCQNDNKNVNPKVRHSYYGQSTAPVLRKSNPIVRSTKSHSTAPGHPEYDVRTQGSIYTNHHRTIIKIKPSLSLPKKTGRGDNAKQPKKSAAVDHVEDEKLKAEIVQIFEYWKLKMGSRAKMIPESLIRRRLKIYSVSELCQAIDGCLHDDWLMGRDPKTDGKKFNTLEYIFREKHIDKLISYAENPPAKPEENELKRLNDRKNELLNWKKEQ